MSMIWSRQPHKLERNRVWRTYEGGRLIDEWQRTEDPEDGEMPEEWISSVITARNPGREHLSDEGLSMVELPDGSYMSLRKLIALDPEAFLGRKHVDRHGAHPGVLIKILDSSERLTIQVHPDRETAQRLFDSQFGKTEAWYILGGREINGEPPYVLFGFKPGVTREHWEELFRKQDIAGMVEALHKIEVKPGDVFIVEGGVPHAIGSGCFLVEIQEPTDYTIRIERTTPNGRVLADASCHQGIGFDRMFDCFHYDNYTEAGVLSKFRLQPEKTLDTADCEESVLIGYDNTPYFSMNSLIVYSHCILRAEGSFSSLIVLEGEGLLTWDGGELAIKQGEQLFLPAGAERIVCRSTRSGRLHLARCFPPQAEE
jgi:mannose-6-phosphate isomerase